MERESWLGREEIDLIEKQAVGRAEWRGGTDGERLKRRELWLKHKWRRWERGASRPHRRLPPQNLEQTDSLCLFSFSPPPASLFICYFFLRWALERRTHTHTQRHTHTHTHTQTWALHYQCGRQCMLAKWFCWALPSSPSLPWLFKNLITTIIWCLFVWVIITFCKRQTANENTDPAVIEVAGLVLYHAGTHTHTHTHTHTGSNSEQSSF